MEHPRNNTGYVRRFSEEDQDDFLNGIDWDKFKLVLRKSLPWILAIMLVTNAMAYIYIRYTKPIYESSSELKLDIKSEASLFGFNNMPENNTNFNNLSGEIELIKSRLFFNKVIKVLDLDVNYYVYGNILNDERYRNSPFKISYNIKNEAFFDKPFDINILSPQRFLMKYSMGEEEVAAEYAFNQTISTPDFDFVFVLTDKFEAGSASSNYYFTVNSERTLIEYLEENLNVQPKNLNANTIQIAFKDYNRYKARDLVNAIDTLYLEYTKEEKNKANAQKIAFLDEQLALTEGRLDQFEDYFEEFTIDNRTIDLQSDINKTIEQMQKLDSQKYELKTSLVDLDDIQQQINDSDSLSLIPLAFRNIPADIKAVLEELNKLNGTYKILLSSYNRNTYAVNRKKQEIAIMQSEIDEKLAAYRRQLARDIRSIDQRRVQLEKNFINLPSKSTEFSKSKRGYALYEEFFLSLMQKKNEFEIANAGTTTNFVILSSATLPADPIFPKSLIIIGIGAVSGIIFSLFFVGTRYLLHNKISSVTELEKITNAPVLGAVPYYNKGKNNYTRLVISKNPKSAISESLRSIRTNLEFMIHIKTQKLLSVTSTISGEGKTFVSVNLGAIIAASKIRTIIVDVDMRRPKIHLAFNEENSAKGVSTILIKKHTMLECIRKTSLEALDYIPAGPTPPNPSELILSPEFDLLLEKLKEHYDMIIFDTPPVGLVTDGILVMKKVDLPIYVVRADYSKRMFIKTLNKLQHTHQFNNIAVILNSLKNNNTYGYGGYGYGYYDYSQDEEQGDSWLSMFKGKK